MVNKIIRGTIFRMVQKELDPFTLLLPVRYEGFFYDRHNESATALKQFIHEASGRILRPNQLGQLASGLAQGQIFTNEGHPKLNLYSVAGNGRGITFHDPEALYYRWSELEKKVGPTMQEAMCNIIDYALADSMAGTAQTM